MALAARLASIPASLLLAELCDGGRAAGCAAAPARLVESPEVNAAGAADGAGRLRAEADGPPAAAMDVATAAPVDVAGLGAGLEPAAHGGGGGAACSAGAGSAGAAAATAVTEMMSRTR